MVMNKKDINNQIQKKHQSLQLMFLALTAKKLLSFFLKST